MQHHSHHSNYHFSSYRHRWCHRPPQPMVLQPGEVAFRVVCHDSIIGGLIGYSGSIISQIRRDTGCTVHCGELVEGSEHRVIVIVGPVSPRRRILLKSIEGNEEEKKELVSVAQEAVIRVCERMWEVDTQTGIVNNSENGVSEGYCGLLADTTQIGVVVGRGGKNAVRMRRESGAQIRILPAPLCAAKGDELIQITGDILAVKRALVAVTECLHDCPPNSRDPMLLARPVETTSHMPSSDPHTEFFPHLSPLLPPLTENSPCPHSLSSDADDDINRYAKSVQQEVSFRLLCSNGAAGSIIGKRGSIVRILQNETGASIMFAAPITMSGERIVTISAIENLESQYSPAQKAVILVFARSVEHDIEKGHPSALIKGTTVAARLLVASDVVRCLDGNSGWIDSEMAVSGADIQILEGEQILDFSSENDVVIEITGEYKNVQNALFLVTGKLRDNLLPSEVLNEVRARNSHGVMEISSPRMQQPTVLSLDSEQETNLTRGMGQLGLSSYLGDASVPGLQLQEKLGRAHTTRSKNREDSLETSGNGSELERSLQVLLPKEVLNKVGARSSGGQGREANFTGSNSSLGLASDPNRECISTQGNNKPELSSNIGHPSPAMYLSQTAGRGSAAFGGNVEPESLRSEKKYPIVANTIVELIIPEDMLGSVYGEDGSNLTRLRQISGAKVEVRDPSPGKSEWMVVIAGTPDQTRAAQSLLQAFILADQ